MNYGRLFVAVLAVLAVEGAGAPEDVGTPSVPVRPGDVFAVQEFGAKGDGIHDDTSAIQKAMSAATIAHGLVLFRATVYSVNATLVVPSNVTLRGYGATLKFMDAAPYDSVLRLDHVSNVVVEGLEIDGRKASVTVATEFKHGIAVLSSSDV